MELIYLIEKGLIDKDKDEFSTVYFDGHDKFVVYPKSIIDQNGCVFFIGKIEAEKYLFVISGSDKNELFDIFDGEKIISVALKNYLVKKCPLNTKNRKAIQSVFEFANPVPLGLNNSFGFGDRLGLANAGHLRALSSSRFKPVLAQQSIRELTRTNRTPDEVMDAAVWAVFQEGYKKGFGSDADHLKTTADIDYLLSAGFTMFTFDPGEHVDNYADSYSESELIEKVEKLPWMNLNDTLSNMINRYVDAEITISGSLRFRASKTETLRALAKYGRAIAHIRLMYIHLKSKTHENKFEVEVSVDETESVTSPFEHYFVVNELNRLGVKFISLAPRFVGSFEKGIDYKGDLDLFKSEYEKHLSVVKHFGNYKISLHSGSDKFSVYRIIGSMREAVTHVKTAGTSYLEALRVVAAKQPDLFREIFDFSLNLYNEEKNSYHVSADINNIKNTDEYSDPELVKLFESDDARQIMHVTFGKVLTAKTENGNLLFKEKIVNCLKINEDVHNIFLIKHFHKHLEPFN